MPSVRLDQCLVQRGLAESREKAQRLIRAGKVLVNEQLVDKPGQPCAVDATIVVEEPPRFVGRGGEKLEAALEEFPVSVAGSVCMDVGASTGGFTDCLLQRGARRVYAIDVGRGQLHWKLRQDERVTVCEGVNARHLDVSDFDETPVLAVVDVSFISLTKVLPAITRVMATDGEAITLIKPQFEAGRAEVGKGGVVRDPSVHTHVIETIRQFGEKELGWTWMGYCKSPLKGPAGNVEFLAYWRKI